MRKDELDFISSILKNGSGQVITRDKIYLLESRLLPLAKKFGFKDLSGFIRNMQAKPDEKLVTETIDAMTTNESMFFRDRKPFEHLRRIILPRLKHARPDGGRIRIWSSACSTGQEPYSVAICLREETQVMPEFDFEIIATDISARVLEKAKQGIYSPFEVQRGMPKRFLHKYFTQLPDGNWQIEEKLRNMVEFRQQNLIRNINLPGKFDIILCRNVLIYFDEPTKRDTLHKIGSMMNPGGVLLVGSTENITGMIDQYVKDEHGLYILEDSLRK